MNIGIYGGTFDPPHIGHVTAARAAMEVLGLDKLVLVPDAQPPHKALPEGGAAPRQRYDMAVLATAALGKRAEVSDMELRRSGVSYTADTLAALREQYPDDTLYLLMGSDMFLSLHNWRRPEAIMAMAHIAPFSREAEDESAAFAAQSARLEREFGAQVTVVPNPQVVELSSTEVRAALAQGVGEDLLPPPVWGYIRREHLYGTHTDLTHLTPEELLRCARANGDAGLSILVKTAANAPLLDAAAPFSRSYALPGAGTRYYLCQGNTCHAPVERLEDLPGGFAYGKKSAQADSSSRFSPPASR